MTRRRLDLGSSAPPEEGVEETGADVEKQGIYRPKEKRSLHPAALLRVEDAHPLLKDTFRDATLIRDPIITRSIYPIIKRLNEILNQARQWVRVKSGQNVNLRYELENNLGLLNTKIDRYASRSIQNEIYLTPLKEEINRVISHYLLGLDEEQRQLKVRQEQVGELIERARAKIRTATDGSNRVGPYTMPRDKRGMPGRDPDKK